MSAYLELLKDALLNLHYLKHEPMHPKHKEKTYEGKLKRRLVGRDWPTWAVTMVGRKRLDHLEACIKSCAMEGVRGDFLETGVWRGGASIFARACVDECAWAGGVPPTVWLADSFDGCPKPNPTKWPKDAASKHSERDNFRVPLAVVKANFKRFRVPLDGVRFMPGWFEDTLPGEIERLAILRLDGDMYGSTMHALRTLYDKVSPGGFIIADDWKASRRERAAIEDFWKERGIRPPTTKVDWTCMAWRKE